MALLDCLKCCRVINMDTNEVLYEATDEETEKYDKLVEILEPVCEAEGSDLDSFRNPDLPKWRLSSNEVLDQSGACIPYAEIVIQAAYLMSKGLTYDEACDEELYEESHKYKIEYPDLDVATIAEDIEISF